MNVSVVVKIVILCSGVKVIIEMLIIVPLTIKPYTLVNFTNKYHIIDAAL